jgi:hypothetical protein
MMHGQPNIKIQTFVCLSSNLEKTGYSNFDCSQENDRKYPVEYKEKQENCWCSGNRVEKVLFVVTKPMCLKVGQIVFWDIHDFYSPGLPEKELFLQTKMTKIVY